MVLIQSCLPFYSKLANLVFECDFITNKHPSLVPSVFFIPLQLKSPLKMLSKHETLSACRECGLI
jgi:hypothetical protein